MGNYTEAEYIAFFIINCCFIAINNFRGHVSHSSTFFEVLSKALLLEIYRKPEIYNFEAKSMYINDDVLWFDISMDDLFLMTFVDS